MSQSQSSQLFIGHLHQDVSHRDFERRFGKYGKMKRCEMKKGYGFIEYEDIRDAEDAIKDENDATFHGNRIVVEWARGSSRYSGRNNDRYRKSYDERSDRSRRYREREDSDRPRRRRRSSPEYKSKRRDKRRSHTSRSDSRSRSRSPSDVKSRSGKRRE